VISAAKVLVISGGGAVALGFLIIGIATALLATAETIESVQSLQRTVGAGYIVAGLGFLLSVFGIVGLGIRVEQLIRPQEARPITTAVGPSDLPFGTIIICPECGAKNLRTDNVCRNCERNLDEAKKRLREASKG